MRKKQWTAILLILVCLSAHTQQSIITRNDKCVALIWAIADYKDGDHLQTPVRDAMALKEELLRLGFQTIIVDTNCTKQELNHSLQHFCEEADSADMALFFYAGHGLQGENDYGMWENYLLPLDWQRCCIPGSCIPLTRVAKNLNRLKNCRTKMMFVDACRTHVQGSNELTFIQMPRMYNNLWYCFSTCEGEKAADGEDHSPFVASLLRQLEEPNVRIADLLNRISLGMGDAQRPVYNSSGRGNFVFHPDVEDNSNALWIDCHGTLVKCDTAAHGKAVIPSTVKAIGDFAFSNCCRLTSITIPNSVISIGNIAFNGCSGLTSITIPKSVTSIGDYAFNGCSGLTSVTIPNSVTSIGNYAFSGCSGVTNITISNSVIAIGDWAFSGCSGLTCITIPNSVTIIGEGAFNECSGVTSITIPESVTTIGNSAFSKCSGLTSITIPHSVTTIGDWVFSGCSRLTSIHVGSDNPIYNDGNGLNCIIETSSNALISGCAKTIIPNSVTSIGNSAFSGHTGLTRIAIPESVTTIGNYAFSKCSGLSSITIPNSVTHIGNFAFFDCSGLNSITIPNSVTFIGYRAFDNCNQLESIYVHEESYERIKKILPKKHLDKVKILNQ